VDFTSALYLGFRHESRSLRFAALTTGTPAALHCPPAAKAAADAFAKLTGCASAVAMTSTLHAFMDLFGQVGRRQVLLHDDAVYPVVSWGLERAERRGARLVPFRHLDPAALARRLSDLGASAARAWVVTDGLCAGCGRLAPLDEYAALARQCGGRLVVDDTQAIGVLGDAPTAEAPLGRGGGGSLRRWGLAGGDLILVASLAKAFGAPLAMVAGGGPVIEKLAARSDTLTHCSPPSAASLAAAQNALAENAVHGDRLRAKLVARVQTLRRALRRRGIAPAGGLLPVQRVGVRTLDAALALQAALARRGIRVLIVRARCTGAIAITFITTARHGEAELHTAAGALAAAARGGRGDLLLAPLTLEA
jgi:8-amino-7-oxononanoate synthase